MIPSLIFLSVGKVVKSVLKVSKREKLVPKLTPEAALYYKKQEKCVFSTRYLHAFTFLGKKNLLKFFWQIY